MKRRGSHKECQLIAPDGRWGWVIVIGATMICMCAPSIIGCFGLIIWDIRRTMGTSVATTAFVASIAQSLNFLSTPFVAMLGYTFSFRRIAFAGGLLMSSGLILASFVERIELLYLTFGLLGGFGFGFSTKSSLFVVNEFFDKRRGLATGIFYSGAALGRFIFPLIIHYLLEKYGYRGTLLIWGAIIANICVCACLYQPLRWHRIHSPETECCEQLHKILKKETIVKQKTPENVELLQPFLTEKTQAETQIAVNGYSNGSLHNDKQIKNNGIDRVNNSSCFTRLFKALDYSVFRVPRFYVVAIGYICSTFANVNTYVFLPPLGRSHGFSSDESAWLVPSLGIGEIFGRIIVPWMVDHHIFKPSYAYVIGVGICSALSLILTFPMPYTAILGLCFVNGLACGSSTGITTLLSVEAVGKERLSSAISFTQFGQGILTLPSGFILGAIRDVTGSYFQCFYVISVVYFLSLLFWVLEFMRTSFCIQINLK